MLARQSGLGKKSAKKRSLQVVNEHFELIFNNVLTTKVIIQRFLK